MDIAFESDDSFIDNQSFDNVQVFCDSDILFDYDVTVQSPILKVFKLNKSEFMLALCSPLNTPDSQFISAVSLQGLPHVITTYSLDISDHMYSLQQTDITPPLLLPCILDIPFVWFLQRSSYVSSNQRVIIQLTKPNQQVSVSLHTLNVNLLLQAIGLHCSQAALVSNWLNNTIYVTFSSGHLVGHSFLHDYNKFHSL